MAIRILAALAVLFLLSATILAQTRAFNPHRADGVASPGSTAVVTGARFANIEYPEASPTLLPLATEVAGVSITVDGISAGVWCVFASSVHLVVPDNLPIIPRQPPVLVRITTPLGVFTTSLKVARAAPGLVTDGKGGPAGYWIANQQFFSLSASGGVIVNRTDNPTFLAVWATGIRGARRPLRNRAWMPAEPWFQADCWLWIGSRRIPAAWHETGIPGLDYVCAYLPLDLPAGKYELRVEAGRVKSEPLPLEVW